MDFIQLEVFRAVAEELHFGRAAERLHLAQPYLSRTIRALETDLGTPLFDRTTRRVELTPAGRALLEPAEAILRMGERARSDVEAAHRGDSGRVRFSFAGPSSQVMVGTLAQAVRERYRRIDLAARPGRYGPMAVRELLEHTTDLAIARFEHAPPGVQSRPLARERGVLAVPSDHPVARRESVSFAELRDEPFIMLPETSGSAVRAQFVSRCHTAGFAPDIVHSAPDSWTCIALVAAGVGLHFTIDSALNQMPLNGVRIVSLTDEIPPIFSYLLWRTDDRDPALAKVLKVSEQALPTAATSVDADRQTIKR
ncbi:LysR substrate-binding domain-containing protein [Amycolatopsis taiwanensis]|uniref:LysR family transcriptional regulator n=1 Tax=Amycolatopsis taiwanensis TaxID=342230 RepID=A0A9W6R6X4_9PSEU|nr:LysR substrate-binding domain-containing protein [Amycolatopsis taiwanensis]GLY70526.1 LysR family transcriptional regulator [Amycolatopsis taiwanensis]